MTVMASDQNPLRLTTPLVGRGMRSKTSESYAIWPLPPPPSDLSRQWIQARVLIAAMSLQ